MNRKLRITLLFLSIIGIALAQSNVNAQPATINFDFTQQSLEEMPKTTVYAELYCDGFLLTGADWSGVQLSYLLNQLNASADINSIRFTASDSYTVAIPIDVALLPQTIIAYQINGQPLPEGLRLILPDCNGASWISHIVSMSASPEVVAAPAPISVGGMSNNRLNDLGVNTASPTPTHTPTPTSSVPAPTSAPATPTPTPTQVPIPTNNTAIEPSPKQQALDQQAIGLDQKAIALVMIVLVVGLTIAILAYKRRNILKPI